MMGTLAPDVCASGKKQNWGKLAAYLSQHGEGFLLQGLLCLTNFILFVFAIEKENQYI